MLPIAHKIRLSPNNKQETYFKKGCGTARFAWNWALEAWNESYKAGERPSGLQLKKQFNAIKKQEFPWVYQVTKYACQQPFLQLQQAWKRFFKGLGSKPKFKSKHKSQDSFYIGGDQIKVNGNKVKIPNLGWVKMTETIRFDGKINSATISRTADAWYISFQIETADALLNVRENQTHIGIDLGLTNFATFSNGVAIAPPKPLHEYLRRLARLNRQLVRKQKGSNNFKKAKKRLARLHARIANIRRDFLHKITTALTTNFSHIAVESLNVSGMIKNKRLAKSIVSAKPRGWFFSNAAIQSRMVWLYDSCC